ncbi:MAG: type II secretion system protein GspH [Polaromonas sp.]|nr:MAG: type II secretion system protein GspH [Polaromonas sp.]
MLPVRSFTACNANRLTRGFTLLELLVVIAIMALATSGVSLAMRDNAQTALEREAQRLVVLFESARAQSRTSGVRVIWYATDSGFKFEGLAPGALPERWLTESTSVRGMAIVQLGPEPLIGPQAVELVARQPAGQAAEQGSSSLRVATDGLRPFAVNAVSQP